MNNWEWWLLDGIVVVGAVAALFRFVRVIIATRRAAALEKREVIISATIMRVVAEQATKEQRADIGKYDRASRLVACLQRYDRYVTLEKVPKPDDLEQRMRKVLVPSG